MRALLLVVAAIAATALLPTPASAATTLGRMQTVDFMTTRCPAGSPSYVLQSRSGAFARSYVVPAGGGVITQFRTTHIGDPGSLFWFRLFVRTGAPASARAVASVPATAAGMAPVAVSTRLPVAGGEILGLSKRFSGALNCTYITTDPDDEVGYAVGDDPRNGEDPAAPFASESSRAVNMEATLEPDTDKDGFGDESQDACPGDGLDQAAPCGADLELGAAFSEASIPDGGVGVLALSARELNAHAAPGARVTATLPAGLELIATTPSSGGCAPGPAVDCTLDTIPANGRSLVMAVVRARGAGARSVSGSIGSPVADPNPANNAASAALNVTAVRAGARFCRVPRLRRLSRTAARRALTAAGCRLGKVRKPKSGRRLRVRSQTIPARTRVARRTKVGIRLRATRKARARRGRS